MSPAVGVPLLNGIRMLCLTRVFFRPDTQVCSREIIWHHSGSLRIFLSVMPTRGLVAYVAYMERPMGVYDDAGVRSYRCTTTYNKGICKANETLGRKLRAAPTVVRGRRRQPEANRLRSVASYSVEL